MSIKTKKLETEKGTPQKFEVKDIATVKDVNEANVNIVSRITEYTKAELAQKITDIETQIKGAKADILYYQSIQKQITNL
jgi:hypothetical protein